MILRALYDYYRAHRNELPDEGLEWVEIGFIILIDKEGNFQGFDDRRNKDKKSAVQFLVRKKVGRSSAFVANYLYDNISYTLGYAKTEGLDEEEVIKENDRANKCFEAFKTKINEIYNKDNGNHISISALKAFYDKDPRTMYSAFMQDALWRDIEKSLTTKYAFFSFRLVDKNSDKNNNYTEDYIMAEQQELINLDIDLSDIDKNTTDTISARCLITGQKGPIVKTTTATMIPGSQATAKLVSFQVNMGYDSYGKTQGANAPISKEAEFAYTTALKKMLDHNSDNKFRIADRTFLLWSSNKEKINNAIIRYISKQINPQDNTDEDEDISPDGDLESIKQIFNSILSGKRPALSKERFYILGLAPNVARIAVVYWADLSLKELASNILAHLEDMAITSNFKMQGRYTGAYAILTALLPKPKTADTVRIKLKLASDKKNEENIPKQKIEGIPRNLPEAIIKSIFHNHRYPTQLYEVCLRRILVERTVTPTRAAIIKACLNRNYHNKFTKTMDLNNTNAGYLCGRLFAVLDKIQSDASESQITTVRDNYMSAACHTPLTVFPNLCLLSNHHLKKLSEIRKGSVIYYERLISEIISKLKGEFPKRLNNQEQGAFIVGYYHQKEDLFTSKKEKEDNEN
ncbi:MAG: type I-C CRISPR-associated protein Cas8c/Csd1 [Muribaculaceae bacterium]|nr:type I-C CRISPR-associated protein Cas8c/Csd1 [Muribaculaceae bacterium]